MKIGVLGGGAWGTALAQVAAAGGHDVLLWAIEPDVVTAINAQHQNSTYLPGIALNPAIRATANLADMQDRAALLVVTPAQHMRSVIAGAPVGSAPLILCAKGIEANSRLLMSEVAHEVHPAAPIAVLSGPTFAAEVARGLPTAITLACADRALGEELVAALGQPTFRPYWSGDVIGAEVGGAVKNVLAIACGIVEGRGMGENARAALITRGFAELLRFGAARGARSETLMGLCGLGDLILTCSSRASRNMSLGFALGQGQSAQEALSGKLSVAEGAATAPVLAQAAAAIGVDMPICAAVAAILAGDIPVGDAIERLLARPFKAELDSRASK
jgi:glycerol-3-phosphate dehydrogenase (NAD(P)+)